MKSVQAPLICLVFAVLHPPSVAASFMAPKRASLVGEALAVGHDKNKDMPVTTHNKTKGDGYNPGSPLFKKQEKQAEKKAPPAKPAAKKSTPVGMPGGAWLSNTVGNPKIFSVSLKDAQENFFGAKDHVFQGLTFFCSYFIFTLLVALIWIKCTSPGRYEEGEDFRANKAASWWGCNFAHGIFAADHCLGHHGIICFCAWCCPAIRMADTYAKKPFPLLGGEKSGHTGFLVALVIIAGLVGLTRLTYGFTSFVLFCMAIYYRQQLRKQYDLPHGGMSCVSDILAWCCCQPCAIVQEARQVEFVLKPNDPNREAKSQVHDHWGVAK